MVLGAYVPCTNLGLGVYYEYLVGLISESQRYGPVLIVSDFNAHFRSLRGSREQDVPNQQRVLLRQLLDHCELYAVSLSRGFCLFSGTLKFKQQLIISL